MRLPQCQTYHPKKNALSSTSDNMFDLTQNTWVLEIECEIPTVDELNKNSSQRIWAYLVYLQKQKPSVNGWFFTMLSHAIPK